MVIRAICCYVFTLPTVLCLFVSWGFEDTYLVNACRHTRCSCSVSCCSCSSVRSLFMIAHTCMFVNKWLHAIDHILSSKPNAIDRYRYKPKVPYVLMHAYSRVPFAWLGDTGNYQRWALRRLGVRNPIGPWTPGQHRALSAGKHRTFEKTTYTLVTSIFAAMFVDYISSSRPIVVLCTPNGKSDARLTLFDVSGRTIFFVVNQPSVALEYQVRTESQT